MTSGQAQRFPADRPLAEPPACNSGGTAPRAEGEPPGDSLSTRWRRWPPARAQAGLLPPPLGPFPSPPVQLCIRLEEAQAWQCGRGRLHLLSVCVPRSLSPRPSPYTPWTADFAHRDRTSPDLTRPTLQPAAPAPDCPADRPSTPQ
ncbi:hypothetical protein DV515_00015080 [Chloebia gouldiae]|uniref:Uncharacterized protein n=1 Tax=Chloebia gouldiae TaxID=44316 RepID=A0A3L8RW74_CHLGU|nr:hypothetical protein DV515_00015080 [Chloebia gouldiae]